MKKESSQYKLKRQIMALPNTPGVYLMKDATGTVVYVGKAGQLRKRVQSYFTKRVEAPKIQVLRMKIHTIEYINTPTEVEALLLEANLINKYKPRYNSFLKDDKSYPLLKISREEYPRLSITRNKQDKKARYYGPYTDAKLLRAAVRLMNTIFPIRKCTTLPKSPCLYYYLDQCLAPCFKSDTKQEYDRYIKEIEAFLRGDKKSFVEYLTRRMKEAAAKYRFEEAALFKDQIEALSKLKLRKYSIADPGASISLSGTIELKKRLGLKRVPERIVCFDVSNIHGTWAVASKVSFFRELPDKNHYRRYKIKTIQTIDDYAMIQEALRRMLVGIKEGRELCKPDLIMIDGGKGHLHAALEVIEQEGFAIACLAIAKKFESIFMRTSGAPIDFPINSPALNVLKRIRDEAHRFAIEYHRSLRTKALSTSELDTIKGIGAVRKKRLLQVFPSLDAVRRASVAEIARIKGFNRKIAEQILRDLKKP